MPSTARGLSTNPDKHPKPNVMAMAANTPTVHSPRETEQLFYHGFDNYMNHAFPEDELRPVSCKPLTRDQSNPLHYELNDALGNYSLTLIDSLSTLAILASSSSHSTDANPRALRSFQDGVALLVDYYGDGTDGVGGLGKRGRGFDVDSKVQVFETVIRGVGGLLSAHLFAIGELPIRGYDPGSQIRTSDGDGQRQIKWSRKFYYNGQLLRLAHDLGKRLLPAFYTPTGLPYPRVNLRHGVPFYDNSPYNLNAQEGQCRPAQGQNGELTETCSAGAGSLVLELTVLSRLTGDNRFEQLGKRAFWSIWERRSALGLIGSGIDAESGLWTSPFTGLGAGIDSFFEYAVKSYILLSRSPLPETQSRYSVENLPPMNLAQPLTGEHHDPESFLRVWQEAHDSIRRHLYRGRMYVHPHYVQADLYTGATRAFWMDSLSAFFPGLLALTGDLDEATETHLLFTALWNRYSALPERWSAMTGSVEGGLGWWGGRPEFIESTYYLYRATRDPWYLHVGNMVIQDIKRRCWTECGWSGIQDVRTGELNDRMESFFLGETAKYLFLLYDPGHPLNTVDMPFVFNTEGHPLILPRSSNPIVQGLRRPMVFKQEAGADANTDDMLFCPLPSPPVPLSFSAVTSRSDFFHAANLARLHQMPPPHDINSSKWEFAHGHPIISMLDTGLPLDLIYYPWTLPPELMPRNGISSKILIRPTFDITFPAHPNMAFSPGFLQRVGNGILVNSIGGLRLGMIQDGPLIIGGSGSGEAYRIQAINNIALGRDEKIFLPKDTVASVVSPLDPNFTRIRDTTMLDLVIDVGETRPYSNNDEEASRENKTESESSQRAALAETVDEASGTTSHVKAAFNTLLQHVSAMLLDQPLVGNPKKLREYVAAITPTGPGTAPLPDVEEALGPDASGAPQGLLIWHSIYVTDENCDATLSARIPKEHQAIVIKRGGCSFSQKLQNIPSFAPSANSLQIVIVVSYQDEDDLNPDWLIRPLLESTQFTSSGLPRRNPIPMIMVGGGQRMYDIFQRAVGIGIKRRYSIHAQGVPISNLVII